MKRLDLSRGRRRKLLAPSRREASVPVVPHVPVQCPACFGRKVRTYGCHDLLAGRTRYHLCACGQKFVSREIDPRSVFRW